MPNALYYGNNLSILRDYIPSESVDLIYLDPPFQSSRDYNVLFTEKDGTRAAAQIKAFEDTWTWDQAAAASYQSVVEAGGNVSRVMQAFMTILGGTDMMAYLSMMAPRLIELHRVLKSTGTIYLHCDPTASHYLRVLMDGVFGPKRFLNEIIWKRSSAHSDIKQGMRRLGRIHDTLLLYTKSPEYIWNPLYTPYTKEYLESEYRHVTKDGRYYKETDLTAAKPGGDTEFEWHVRRRANSDDRWEADLEDEYLTPVEGFEYRSVTPYQGRFWAYSKANLIQFAKEGKLIHRSTGMPRLMQFADEMPGIPLQDLWDDIPPASGNEDLGYPTQKPEELLARIIRTSSNKGDVVLDPFCGCGTAIAVAQALDRSWIGIDITHLAIGLIKHRLQNTYGGQVGFAVVGEPVSLPDAEQLARSDPYQFQWWAAGTLGARLTENKKGADRGIDGRLYFHDDQRTGETKQIILSVKSGHIPANHIRELRGVIEREGAQIGVLLTLEPPTRMMRAEAASAGFYNSPFYSRHPRLQIITVEEMLVGKRIDYPQTQVNVTYKKAKPYKAEPARNRAFEFTEAAAEVPTEPESEPSSKEIGAKADRRGRARRRVD